ncbi:hypothetical protein [Nostoc sp.]|uniref:hypothetical protein n=1 Tax=Nostoc sp. TaxID=1180 RepID=UPI002FF7D585
MAGCPPHKNHPWIQQCRIFYAVLNDLSADVAVVVLRRHRCNTARCLDILLFKFRSLAVRYGN